jgi:hypothetical protein
VSVTLYHTATEYTSNALTFLRGSQAAVTKVGLYHTTNAGYIPAVTDFVTVTLADGTTTPPNPLAIPGEIDVVASIGPRGQITGLTAGDYQRWVYVQTTAEDIIRQTDVLVIL